MIRLSVRYDQNVDNKGGNKLLRMAGNYPLHSMYIAAQMETAPKELFVMYESVDTGVPGPMTYAGGVAGNRQWHKVEIYQKNNTIGQRDGIIRIWNDGVLKIDYTGQTRTSKGTPWAELVLMSNRSSNPGWEHNALNNVYWDDIEIYSDAGSGGFGSMANATITATALTAPPPKPPTALRVIR